MRLLKINYCKLGTTMLPCLCRVFTVSLQEMTLRLALAMTFAVIRQSTNPATGTASASALLVQMTLVLIHLPGRHRPAGQQLPPGVLHSWKIAQAD